MEYPIKKPRDVVKASRRYRNCELKNNNLERDRSLGPSGRGFKPDKNGFYNIRFNLLNKFSEVVAVADYVKCDGYEKRKLLFPCLVGNLRKYLADIEIKHGYKFKVKT